jgi:sigma-B regulation protein RsbU (phosphoserine phosphatase)
MNPTNTTVDKISLLEHVVESMNEMVCVVDELGNVLYSNKKMEKVIGTKTEMKCPAMTAGKGCETCYANICIEQGRPQNANYELNGRVYSVAFSPIRDEDGTVINALEVWSDVTGEKRLKERLTAQNELLRSDLRMASVLQQSMLPYGIESIGGVKFDMKYFPCEDVGGDFCDIFVLDDDNVAFYIADVSGHGVSAAMLTVFFSQALKSIMNTKKDAAEPEEVLSEVWDRFMGIDLQEHLYITAWLGVLNTKTGELKYSNAGHIISPLLYDGLNVAPMEAQGYPICRWIPNSHFPQKNIIVPKHGRVLLYTDGLSDAWRQIEGTGAQYMFKTPDELAESCVRMSSFSEILDSIWQGVRLNEYGIKLSDDVAMLVVERT